MNHWIISQTEFSSVSWEEITNKPLTFVHDIHTHNYAPNGVFKIFAQPIPSEGGEINLFYPGRSDDSQNLCWVIDAHGSAESPDLRIYRYNADGVLINLVLKNDGTINFPSLKNNPDNLVAGDVWRDSSGFLRVV